MLTKHIPQSIKNIFHFLKAKCAVLFWGSPAKDLTVIGVTGTDGKTTTATLIYEFLHSAGRKVALITTVSAKIGDEDIDTGFHVSTPAPWQLQKLLKRIKDEGYEYVVLEATSHGLDQHRLLGAHITTAVVTNITHEHLDYHKTYARYVKAKAKIFKDAQIAIINEDDESFDLLKKKIHKNTHAKYYSSRTLKGDLKKVVKKTFPESYNQLNATAAYLAAKAHGAADADIIAALKSFPGIPGRMENIPNRKGLRIIVDFAHTPHSLEEVLTTLKKQNKKSQKLIIVFGCASERDDDKRPMMGEISARLADISVFTAEDPRREDIWHIFAMMDEGAYKTGAVEIGKDDKLPKGKSVFTHIPERGEAIYYAITKYAQKGDIVVICGKGHEKSMNYDGVEYDWSDQDAVKMALKGKVKKIDR